MAPDWSADVSRRRKIEHVNKKFDSTLSVYFFPFQIFVISLSTTWPRPWGINSSSLLLCVSLVLPEEG